MSVATGKEKYARKTAAAADKWNAAKGRMVQNWQAGMAEAGLTPGPMTTAAYQAGISAAQYRGGNPDKWERNLRAAVSR